MNETEKSSCAHIKVLWTTEDWFSEGLGTTVTRGWWECSECKMRFAPAPVLEISALSAESRISNEMLGASLAEITELRAENERLKDKLERALQLCQECGKGFVDDDWALERQKLEQENAALKKRIDYLEEAALEASRRDPDF